MNLQNFFTGLLIIFILSGNATAREYYISTSGKDNNSGLSPSKPWATLKKIETYDVREGFKPGDRILFCKGDIWHNESFIISSSGMEGKSIIIGNYGTGTDKPIINAGKLHYGIFVQGSFITIDGLEISGGTHREDSENFYLFEQGNILLFSNRGRTYNQKVMKRRSDYFRMINDDNLEFLDGIKIINTTFRDNKNYEISAHGTKNLKIINNEITSSPEFYNEMLENITINGNKESNNSIVLNNTHKTLIEENYFHNIHSAIWHVPQHYFEVDMGGIFIDNDGKIFRACIHSSETLMRLNRFENILTLAIHISGDDHTIEHNVFRNNGYGVYCPGGGNPPCINAVGTNNAVVRYNVMTEVRRACSENLKPGNADNEAVAIYFDCMHTNAKIYGNLVYNVEGPALIMAKSTGMQVYNNTFYDCNKEFSADYWGDGGTIGIWGAVHDKNTKEILSAGIIANNIVMNDNRWEITFAHERKADFFNNIIYHDDSPNYLKGFATKDNNIIAVWDISEFQKIINDRGGIFKNNHFTNPLMVAPGNTDNPDFNLLPGSPCIDRGRKLKTENKIPELNVNMKSVHGYLNSGVLSVGQYGTILELKDNTWNKMLSPTSEQLNAVWYDPYISYIAGNNGSFLARGFWQPDSWVSIETGITSNLNDIWASWCGSVYFVGDEGTILHFNGKDLRSMNSGTKKDLYGVWGTSDNNVYAVGAFNAILHYNGNEDGIWEQVTHAPSGWYWHSGIWGSSKDDIYIVGAGSDEVNFPGTIIHYNGSKWNSIPNPAKTHLYSVWGNASDRPHLHTTWGNASDNVYIVGDKGTVLEYNGFTRGEFVLKDYQITEGLRGVWINSWGQLFIAGDQSTLMPGENEQQWEWILNPETNLLDSNGEISLPLPLMRQKNTDKWTIGAFMYK